MRSHKTLKRSNKTTAPKRKQTRTRRKLRGGSNNRNNSNNRNKDIFIQIPNPNAAGYTSKRLPKRKSNNTTFEQEEKMATYLQNRGAKKPKPTVEQVHQQLQQLNHENQKSLFKKLANMLRKKNRTQPS